MYKILSTTPMPAVDGHVDATSPSAAAGPQDLGATVLPIMVGDDHCGPFVVLSYVEPSDEQMPLSFAHAHASDNWRISVRGTTNMGRDTYEQGQFRFHDGGVPYASDNFAWGPDGGYGIIMFADRRGFAIRPVKAEIAAKVTPEQEAAGAFLGIDMQDPCPGAPAIATTMGRTKRAHLDGGFDTADRVGRDRRPASAWPPASPASRRRAGARVPRLRRRPRGRPGPLDRDGDDRGPGGRVDRRRRRHPGPGRRARRGGRRRAPGPRRRSRRRAARPDRRRPACAARPSTTAPWPGARRRPVDGARRAVGSTREGRVGATVAQLVRRPRHRTA